MHTISSLAEKVKSQAKAERLAFIDFKIRYEGKISRSEITTEFGISDTIASKDVAEYKKITAIKDENCDIIDDDSNLILDRGLRTNIINRDKYKPLININASNALDMLYEGFCRNKLREHEAINYKRACKTINCLNPENVSRITRSIESKKKIKCTYISGSSDNHKERLLDPVGVYFDGLNWVFRAYDNNPIQENSIYKSFHFSRVESVEETEDDCVATIENDSAWNTIIPIHLELHPTLDENAKAGLRLDFGLEKNKNDIVKIEKAVFAWSLLERWNVDTNITPIQKEIRRFNFHLKNADTLKYIPCVSKIITDIKE